MKYYSTLRPITPGACPNKDGMQVVNFEDRQYIEAIDREAWGYVEYTGDIPQEEAAAYELVPEGSKVWYCVMSKIDDQGRCTLAKITATMEAAKQPESTCRETRHADIWSDWFPTPEAANAFIEEALQ